MDEQSLRKRARELLYAYRERLSNEDALRLASAQVDLPGTLFKVEKVTLARLKRFVREAEFQVKVWARRDARKARLEQKRNERQASRIKDRKLHRRRY